ncbi:MAG: amino acid ABC transporter permease [Oscillospiraceae bacterium]|jgi:His/Glu/Gln/Arg/opine family amino acid ABC transporter permease subunit|nr:amino acid ABC transporter permease [Oscillospiraceae bacterium]
MIETFNEAHSLLLQGIQVTVKAALLSIVIGIFVGLVSCLITVARIPVLKWLAAAYVWVVRGTPMLVQALFIYFGCPDVIRTVLPSFTVTPFIAGVITLSLNAGAYLSEIFRSGIQAVNTGQIEASRSLGLSAFTTMRKVVLPQAFKITVPSLVNQFIITVKDTSILTVIGLKEIVNMARQHVSIKYDYFETFIWVGAFYLVVISALMVLSKFVEKKLNYDKKG